MDKHAKTKQSTILIIVGVALLLLFASQNKSSQQTQEELQLVVDGGKKVYEGNIPLLYQTLSFVSPSNYPFTFQFRADYKEGIKTDGTLVTKYGASCAVGDYIIMYACTGPSSSPGTCYRLFGDDYLKTGTNDLINLRIECGEGATDGIYDCYQRNWYTQRIDNRYVGYDCTKPSTPQQMYECVDTDVATMSLIQSFL